MYVLHYALWSGNLYVKLNYLPTIFHVYGTLMENLSSFSRAVSVQKCKSTEKF